MKAVTLWQPFASLVARGLKHYETRSWPARYCGPIAIHAGAWQPGPRTAARAETTSAAVLSPVLLAPLFPDAPVWQMNATQRRDLLLTLPFGAVVATARLTDVLRIAYPPGAPAPSLIDGRGQVVREVDVAEVPFGHYASGRWAWVLANVAALPAPVPARGAQQLWEWHP